MLRWIFISLSLLSVHTLTQQQTFPGRISIGFEMTFWSSSLLLVILNLIDPSSLIDHGWRPVIGTNNTLLTESTLPFLDLLDVPITNRTDFALRTPVLPPKSTLVPTQFFRPSTTTNGKKNHQFSSIQTKLLFSIWMIQNQFYQIHLFLWLYIVRFRMAQGPYLHY